MWLAEYSIYSLPHQPSQIYQGKRKTPWWRILSWRQVWVPVLTYARGCMWNRSSIDCNIDFRALLPLLIASQNFVVKHNLLVCNKVGFYRCVGNVITLYSQLTNSWGIAGSFSQLQKSGPWQCTLNFDHLTLDYGILDFDLHRKEQFDDCYLSFTKSLPTSSFETYVLGIGIRRLW